MLVTRHAATEQNPWSRSKFETVFHKPVESLRMSSNFDPVTQSDWHSQYSFLPPGENSIFSQSYENASTSSENAESQAQSRTVTASSMSVDVEASKQTSSPLGHRLDPLGLRQQKQPSPAPEQPENQGETYGQKAGETTHEAPTGSNEAPHIPMEPNALNVNSSAGQESVLVQAQPASEEQSTAKEEVVVAVGDTEMTEPTKQGEEGGGAEGQAQQQTQESADKTIPRRKMKRFRLTHQQTRFLMSEFAKQPHPDAAHRERLSREIPGLSPRQVQVWFQNRRAKIKRMNAEDRERMLKMRAVPDDFDSLSALHSPYGAVHPLGTPMTSPVDLGPSSYTDPMMRPLMVDVRRHEGEDHHLSPSGLSPGFGGIGFNHSGALSTPDILSPLSPTSTDRYGYSNHLSATAPLSAGPRTSNPFTRQTSLDSGIQLHNSHARGQIRPLQPLQLRDTMTRSRSDTLHSPLRTSMSWKGDAIDYTTYHGGNSSPQVTNRPHGLYQDPVGPSSASTLGGYDSTTYSGSAVQSPPHLSYPNFQSSSLPATQRTSRLRAASASLPLGLDIRTQFRPTLGPGSLQSTVHSSGPRSATTSQLGGNAGGVSSSYTASFPSTPLTAPIDFSLPRTPGFPRSTTSTAATDYSMPQLSAPIAPPNDFAQAFQHASLPGAATRTPLRDTFGGAGGPLGLGGHGAGSSAAATDQHRPADSYSSDPLGMKRKRSWTGPTPVTTATGHGPYGSTA